MQPKDHWEEVYSSKAADEVSWFQERAELSLGIIHDHGVPLTASIIDVGAGASTLIEDLLDNGYVNLTVLDLSGAALRAVKTRLGDRASEVQWLEADITEVSLPADSFDVWHDRAVFHFLIHDEARQAYVRTLTRALKPGGLVVLATFAEDGPAQCSGLPVRRYSPDDLRAELGDAFSLLGFVREAHITPTGMEQKFVYCYFRKNGDVGKE